MNKNEASTPIVSSALLGGWFETSKKLPPIMLSVIAFGTLQGENKPDCHEGYWDGREWQSVRREEETYCRLDLDNVSHWMLMPEPPNEKS